MDMGGSAAQSVVLMAIVVVSPPVPVVPPVRRYVDAEERSAPGAGHHI